MKKYRVITNGEKFKAQIRCWFIFVPYWNTLQKCITDNPLFYIDVIHDTYDSAKDSAIEYITKTKPRQKWRPVVVHGPRSRRNEPKK